MKAERRAFLKSYDVDDAIVEAVTREPELAPVVAKEDEAAAAK
jgi:hypothetical protein